MSNKNIVHGVVLDNFFYSNRINKKLSKTIVNGIYSLDMNSKDFWNTISPSDLADAKKYFSKSNAVSFVKGVSFHDGIIPDNPIKYPKFPLKVSDPTFEEFEMVEVALLRNGSAVQAQVIVDGTSYALMDLKDLHEKRTDNISLVKGLTPGMRVAYNLLLTETKIKELEEKRKKELEEPSNLIKELMQQSGADVSSVKKTNQGFEVVWNSAGHRINTLFDHKLRVISAGFCVSGYDTTQSASSVVKLLNDYVDEDSRINYTRT